MSDENNNENNNENPAEGTDIESLMDQMQDVEEKKAEAGAEAAKPEGANIAGAEASGDRNLELILDIPLKVSAELGRSKMLVSDLLNLGQGSVVELNKLAGEPLEILVNDKIIAKGEAVVVNEKFGVRLTDIISPMERVQQLK
tara:strand:+ start:11477 stop:11905 length:429 start_codon:yes stop_codon:yes gene_type:complete